MIHIQRKEHIQFKKQIQSKKHIQLKKHIQTQARVSFKDTLNFYTPHSFKFNLPRSFTAFNPQDNVCLT